MSWRVLTICIVLGAVIGAGMIFLRMGPGIHPKAQASTPAYRNMQRAQRVQQLATALKAYHHDHGQLPIKLDARDSPVCTSSGTNCSQHNFTDLSFLTTAGDYIPGIPEDPLGGAKRWDSGFTVSYALDGTIHLTAPRAELGKTIAVSEQL